MAKGTGHRLTDAQRIEIRNAAPDVTLAALAKQYGTSINTVARYRNGKKAAQPKEAAVKTAPKAASGLRDTLRMVLGLPLSDGDLRVVLGSVIKG